MSWRNPPPRSSPPYPTPTAHKGDEEEAVLSVSDQRTLYLVNIFIVHTARFLNRFSAICEEKLAHVHRRILRLDASLTLLEAQLRSIDGIGELEVRNDRLQVEGPSNESLLRNPSSLETSVDPPRGPGKPLSASFDIHQKNSTSTSTSTSSVQAEGPSVQPSIVAIPHQHFSV